MKTKERIQEKTLRLLLEKGYDGVSITDITRATGLARGLLYHYFRNKEDLFAGIIRELYRRYYRLEKEHLKEKSISEIIVFTSRFFTEAVLGFPEAGERELTLADAYILLYQAALHQPEFAGQLKKYKEEWFAVWKTALLNSFSKGELCTGLNLEPAARHFVYIIQGILLFSNKNTSDTLYELEKSLREFYEIIKRP